LKEKREPGHAEKGKKTLEGRRGTLVTHNLFLKKRRKGGFISIPTQEGGSAEIEEEKASSSSRSKKGGGEGEFPGKLEKKKK